MWLGADRGELENLMDTLRHWGWVLSQTELPASATDRLVWQLTGLGAFLLLIAVILFLALRAAWKNR